MFPSRRAKGGHLTTVAKQFRDARSEAGLPGALVLYCARHTFGTAAYGATGNLAMVMNVMGHWSYFPPLPHAGFLRVTVASSSVSISGFGKSHVWLERETVTVW